MKKSRGHIGGSGDIFAEEHSQLFLLFGLTWPPSDRMKLTICDCDVIEQKITQRPLEVVIFLALAHPYPGPKGANVDADGFQYCDINPSLLRLVGSDGKRNPWRDFIPTMTCKSMILVRGAMMDVVTQRVIVKYHVLDGVEMLAATGWPVHLIKPSWKSYESTFLQKMAGNAFNGYCFQTLLLAFTAAIGKASTQQPPLPESIDEEADVGTDSECTDES